MNKVSYINQTKEQIKELSTIKKAIQHALKKEQLKNAEFNIIFVDNERIWEINRQYRKKDSVTDVISFSFEDNEEFINEEYRLLGEIYISIDKAREQAVEYGHSELRELSFLAIHGLLHLLGYDHMEKEEEEIMIQKQEEILNEVGIKRQ